MKITFLGTGTSDGVPMVACGCRVCRSRDRRDNRTRTSAMIEHEGKRIIIDTGIDFRAQMLRHRVNRIDAIMLTHPHADHVFGLDELRQYNRIAGTIPIYANRYTIGEIHTRFGYFFNPPQRGGGVSDIDLIEMKRPMQVCGLTVTPLPVRHGILDILGFQIEDTAYITDASFIPETVLKKIRGCSVLVLNALRYRKHPTHFNIAQAVAIAEQVKAKHTYFVHMTHDVMHRELVRELPRGMAPAYDGLSLTV
ncbi:MAG: MBL fold metallo-hydrolase [Spirochaetes bacterium]|nr:MBL fold metallo-hydrolase [Spirochaetota bacterium]